MPEGTASARRGPAPARPHTADELADAKLGLLEFLISWDDLREVAARSLEWLLEFGGVRRAACFSVELDGNRMVLLGARGFALEDAGAGLVIDLDDRKHPLVAAAERRVPAPLDGTFRDPRLAALLGRTPLHGVPLQGRHGRDEWTSGLLVLDPWNDESEPAATWLVRVLGHRLLTGSRLPLRHRARQEEPPRAPAARQRARPHPADRAGGRDARRQRARAVAARDRGGRQRGPAPRRLASTTCCCRRRSPSRCCRARAAPREVLLVDPADGSDLLYELLSTSVSDPREGTAVVSILRNVTDLRRAMEEVADNYRRLRLAEADVRAERDRLDLIIDSVADPILVTDSAGALVLMNTPAERLFNVPPGSPPDYAQRVRANDAHFSSFVSNVLPVAGTAARRQHRARRPLDRLAAAGGGGLGRDLLRARRGGRRS